MRNLLIIFIFLILVALLAAVLGGGALACAVATLAYDLGLTSSPPQCLAGSNVSVEGCEGLVVSTQVLEPLPEAIVSWMPRFHVKFSAGCMNPADCPFDGCTDQKIREALIDLVTVERLEIVCSSETFCAGKEGYVTPGDLRARRTRLHICKDNIRSYHNGTFLVAHEMTHLAVNAVAGRVNAEREAYPTRVGELCGFRLQ